MKAFDNLWLDIAKKNNLIIWLYKRYVDDMRNMLPVINKGWRWSNPDNCFQYNHDWLVEDRELGLSDEHRTKGVILEAMNSVVPFLSLTSEFQGTLKIIGCPPLTAMYLLRILSTNIHSLKNLQGQVKHLMPGMPSLNLRCTLL